MTTGAEMPQLATFAPSKEDVVNALSFYFGQPVSPEKLRDYSETHAATYNFPDAFVGQSTKIRDTINNLVEKAPQNWHTTIGLPFRRIEGTVVEWDVSSRPPYPTVTIPEPLGSPRVVCFAGNPLRRPPDATRSIPRRVAHDHLDEASPPRPRRAPRPRHAHRVGLLHDCGRPRALLQPDPIHPILRAGDVQLRRECRAQEHQACGINSMPTPTLLTDVGSRSPQVLFAYLTTRNYDFAYDKSHNVRPKRNIRMAMQHEVSMYAIAQKEGEGFGARRPLLASAGAMVAHARHACNRRQRPRQGGRGLQVPHEALRRHAQPARDSAAALAVHGARAGGEAHVRWPLQH